MGQTPTTTLFAKLSRAIYASINPSTAADGLYVKDIGGNKYELQVTGEVSAENCGIFTGNSPEQNRDALFNITTLGTVKVISFNNSKGGSYSIIGNNNIPAGLILKFANGNRLTGSGTLNIDFNQIEAGNYQIFDDSLTITCSNTSYKSVSFKPAWIGLSPIFKRGSWYFDVTDTTSIHDGAMILKTVNNKVLKRMTDNVIYPEFWGAIGDDNGYVGTNNGPFFNAMFRWLETRPDPYYEIRFKDRRYYTSQTLYLPKVLATVPGEATVWLKIYGPGVAIRASGSIALFHRMPLNDTEVGQLNNNHKLIIEGLYLQSDRASLGSIAMKIACYYGAEFNNVHFSGFDIGCYNYFMTKAIWYNCFWGVNLSKGIVLDSLVGVAGLDQSHAGSASNTCTIENSRIFCEVGSYSAIEIIGSDDPLIRHCVIEGETVQYGLKMDYGGSTNVNQAVIDGIWFENAGGTGGTNLRITGTGVIKISNLQRIYPDILFNLTGSASYTQYIFDNISCSDNLPSGVAFISDTDNPGLVNRSIEFKNCVFSLTSILRDPTRWSDGAIPQNMYIETNDYTNGKTFLTTSSEIFILSRSVVGAPVNRGLNIDSNLIFITDNRASIGGYDNGGGLPGSAGSGYARPRTLHLGDGGAWIDNNGCIFWGQKGVTGTDLYINRQSAGVLNINSTGAIMIPSGTTAQRPASPILNMLRYNLTISDYEKWSGTDWVIFGGGASSLPPKDYYIQTSTGDYITVGATSLTLDAYAGWRGRMARNGANMFLVDTGNFAADSATVDAGEGLFAYNSTTGTYHWRTAANIDDTYQFEAY